MQEQRKKKRGYSPQRTSENKVYVKERGKKYRTEDEEGKKAQ